MGRHPEITVRCGQCGVEFEARSPQASLCSNDCRNTMRRERYRDLDSVRLARLGSALRYGRTARGRVKIIAARELRRKERRLQWYHLRQVELPEWMQAFRREFWRHAQMVHRKTGEHDPRVLVAYRLLRRLSLQEVRSAGNLKTALDRAKHGSPEG
ncbi:MAG: hypothetical protein GY838_13575 [bacterium]|nr:hypothetical protein [bacterium]